jgi:[NiFe] hydrogenase diaphorase moiety small subunit
MSESETVTFTIDARTVSGKTTDTIVQAAREAGIYIPTLCHCPGVVSPGTCRVCTVKMNGRYVASCKTCVQAGAKVEVDTPELRELRKTLIEALFVAGNHFCPACEKSGNCELQALAYRLGILAPRFDFQFPRRAVEARPRKLMIDRNRCILCKRCVLSIKDEKGEHLFTLSNRGHAAMVMVDLEKADALEDEMAQKAMDTCPVGAIIRKGRGFVEPVGTRRYDKAVIGSDIQECSLKTEK